MKVFGVHVHDDRGFAVNLLSQQEYACFVNYEEAEQYARDALAQRPVMYQQNGAPLAQLASIHQVTVSDQDATLCTQTPGAMCAITNSEESTTIVAVMIAPDKYTPEKIYGNDTKHDWYLRQQIYAELKERADPFLQAKFEEQPVATYSNNPRCIVYAITPVEPHLANEILQCVPEKNSRVFANYETAVQYIEQHPYENACKVCINQDTHKQYGITASPIYAVHAIQIPEETYSKFVRPAATVDGYVADLRQFDTMKLRASETQHHNELAPLYQTKSICAVVLNHDRGGEYTLLDSTKLQDFESSVMSSIQERYNTLQQLAQQNWNDMHQPPKQYTYEDPARDLSGRHAEISRPEEVNAGYKLIERWTKVLMDKGYPNFAKSLIVTYSQNVDRFQDFNLETKQSAYKAMESVFRKLQREAAKCGDFETATASQHVVRGAQDALDDMRYDAQQQHAGISREEAAQYGIYVPEEIEV